MRLGAGAVLHPRLRAVPPVAGATVMVAPVKIPAAVDQPQFVVQIAANRVEVDEFNRWVAPLDDSIARTGDVAVVPGTPNVAEAPLGELRSKLLGRDRDPAVRLGPG
jgi:uncharacterized lipoprotein YmbA